MPGIASTNITHETTCSPIPALLFPPSLVRLVVLAATHHLPNASSCVKDQLNGNTFYGEGVCDVTLRVRPSHFQGRYVLI